MREGWRVLHCGCEEPALLLVEKDGWVAALGWCGARRRTHMPRFVAGAVSAKIVTCCKSANTRN